MEKNIQFVLNPVIQKFISENADKNISQLALKYKDVDGVPIQLILQQIQGKQKAKHKLPSWFSGSGLLFPPTLNLEQSSSEITAGYKAGLINGKTMADLTGGFGIDVSSFAKKFEKVFYIERNKDLAEIVKHNFSVLNIDNVEIVSGQAEDFLRTVPKLDAIFLDPARRDQHNKKVFKLDDCEPNVAELLPELFSLSSKVLIKTSPLLDIKATIRELKMISEIHVVAIENECKEVLYLLDSQNYSDDIKIACVNFLKNENEVFGFSIKGEEGASAILGLPAAYLYEPNAAIMKAGAFNSIAEKFQLLKIHSNSHLYTSERLVTGFPGRRFKIEQVCKYDKREVASIVNAGKANITARNFPDSVDQIKKKLGLKDGGDFYLFATTDLNKKLLIIITKKVE